MKKEITTNVYKITFYQEWTGGTTSMADKRAKREWAELKTTSSILGDTEEEAIKNLAFNWINPVVVDIEKIDTYTYYEEIDQDNY